MEAIDNDLSIHDLTFNDTSLQESWRTPAKYKFYKESTDQLLGFIIEKKQDKQDKQNFKLALPVRSNKRESSVIKKRFISFVDFFILSEKSFIKRYWDIIFEFNLAFNIVTNLFYIAYQLPGPTMKRFDRISWIIFCVDILLSFFTEYTDERGKTVRNLKLIAKNYVQGFFLLDVLCIIPLSLVNLEKTEYLIRIIRIIKLPDVIDLTDGTGVSYLLTFFNFGRKEKNGKISYSVKFKIISTFVKIFLTLIFSVYFFGCIWYYFQSSVKDFKYSSSGNLDEQSFGIVYNFSSFSVEEQALRSSYYMLTTLTTVGYGDFYPKNVYEMAFIATTMLFGVALYAVVMGNFNSAIAYWSETTSGTDNRGLLISWLESVEKIHGKMDPSLKTQVLEYFQYYFDNDRLKNLAKNHWEVKNPEDLISISQKYVSELADDIYFEILEKLFSDFLYTFKSYFSNSNFRYHILAYLEPRKYLQNEYLFYSQDTIEEVVFVLSGYVAIGIQIKNEFKSLLDFPEGRTIVGDFSALTKTKSKFDCIAITNLNAFVVNAEVFYNMLDSFYKKDLQNVLGISGGREFNLKRILNEHLQLAGFSHDTLLNVQNRYIKDAINFKVHNEFNEDSIENSLENMNKSFKNLEGDTVKIISDLSKIQNLISKNLKPDVQPYNYQLSYNPRFYIR